MVVCVVLHIELKDLAVFGFSDSSVFYSLLNHVTVIYLHKKNFSCKREIMMTCTP